MTARVLVTGSRDWTDGRTIEQDMRHAYHLLGPYILVSGACPTGADMLAEQVAAHQRLVIERHPADWDAHGRRAGFVRNAHMVTLGADLCLAFIKNDSNGATMTANMAVKAGIPTRIRREVDLD